MGRSILTFTLFAALAAGCAAPARQAPVETSASVAVFDPVGTYDFTTQVEGTSLEGVVTIRRTAAGELTGTLSSPATGDLTLGSVTQNGRELQMRANVEGETLLMRMQVAENGVVTGGWEISTGMSGGVSGRRRGG